VTFDADRTGAIDVTVAINEDSDLAANCSSGGSCASLQSDLTAGTNGAASATCSTSTTDATHCTCEETHAPYVLQGTGSYTLVRSSPGPREGLSRLPDELLIRKMRAVAAPLISSCA
jgi:hypothetical protein